ncbi:MAG: hypothetical protein EZS28_016445, partial [Streblomastix strix]
MKFLESKIFLLHFLNCQVVGDDSRDGYFGRGGGIFVEILSGAQLIISGPSQFKNCYASYRGGGCYLNCLTYGTQIQINGQLEFENCSSDSGGGMYIYIYDQVTVDIDQISFKNCSALSGGGLNSFIDRGGKVNIINWSIFIECKTSSGSGGGIFSDIIDGTLNIEDTTFESCSCTKPGNGGGISLIQGTSSIISIANSSFIDCKTISNSSDQRYGWGGAIFIQTEITAENLNETNFLLTDLVFSECSAVNSIGNNLHIQSIDTYATGEAIENYNLLTVNGTINLYYNNSYQQDYMGIDESDVGDGTTIINNIPLFSRVDIYGGAIYLYIDNEGQVTISNSSFSQCEAESGSAIYLNINNEGQVTISNSSFNQCEAIFGGGIYALIESGGKLTIDGQCNFTQCKAIQGGGIYFSVLGMNSECSLEDVKFEECLSGSNGGGAYFEIYEQGIFSISEVQFINCSASFDGGGLIAYIENAHFSIIGQTSFMNCDSNEQGGGCWFSISGETTDFIQTEHISFDNCTSETGGGIFIKFNDKAMITSNITSFSDCKSRHGGGIYTEIRYGGEINIINQSIFIECKTSGSGGGIYSNIYDGILNIEDTTFDSCFCTQPGNGGGISLYQGSSSIISITNSSFINCKTISNSSDQRYGWGGSIFIQTSSLAENPNELNFLMQNLVFSGCSAVNSIGNNIHIQSTKTYATGEAIENYDLLSVNGTINLYYNNKSGQGNGVAITAYLQTGSQLKIEDSQFILFKCYHTIGGGTIQLNINNEGQVTISNSSFDKCESRLGGAIYSEIFTGGKLTINGLTNFTQCKADYGGGFFAHIAGRNSLLTLEDGLKFDGNNVDNTYGGGVCIYIFDLGQNDNIYGEDIGRGGGLFVGVYSGAQLIMSGTCVFKNCSAVNGGGIFSEIIHGGQINIKNQCIFSECKTSDSGGGIYSDMYNEGTVNIEDAIFDSCTCTQPGNGGGIALIHKPSSIILITNSSFINCKTVTNSSNSSYGWGGAIFIQTEITAENLNTSNFLLKNLIFIGCSAVNTIGNNLHILSIDTYATGEAIKNRNLLTVIDLLNPPNILSDLYTSPSYAYDYMGINQSIETSNWGTINLYFHNPLFEQSFTSNVPNPTYIDSINGKDIKYCGTLQSICKTMKYSIERNPTPFSEIPPSDTNYSIIMTTNTELDTNILINSTTLFNRNIIIQSDGYSPEAEDDSYIKRLISSFLFSTSLFTISETGHLSLLGLHFDNLNKISTVSTPLISLSTDTSDNPQLQIDDCLFEQNTDVQIYHSLIEINGYGNGAALNAQLNGTSKLTIKDGCSFTGCQSTGSGGAIYAVLNYGTVGGIFIEGTSKTSFSSCSTSDQGGAIYLDIDNVTENQDSLRSAIGIGSESRIKIGGKETENDFMNLMGYDNGNTSLAIPLYFVYTEIDSQIYHVNNPNESYNIGSGYDNQYQDEQSQLGAPAIQIEDGCTLLIISNTNFTKLLSGGIQLEAGQGSFASIESCYFTNCGDGSWIAGAVYFVGITGDNLCSISITESQFISCQGQQAGGIVFGDNVIPSSVKNNYFFRNNKLDENGAKDVYFLSNEMQNNIEIIVLILEGYQFDKTDGIGSIVQFLLKFTNCSPSSTTTSILTASSTFPSFPIN